MSHDEAALRARLAASDPARPGGPAEAASPAPASLTASIEEALVSNIDTARAAGEAGPDRARRRRWLAAAAVLLVAVVGAGTAALVGGGDRTGGPGRAAGRVLALGLPAATSSASCMAFDVTILQDMPLAFAGTVRSASDGQVLLDVDRWFAADPAQRRYDAVRLTTPGQNTSAALDGVTFDPGERYLVTATDGQVNGCGFSGPATPDLEAAFEQAFPG